MDLNEYKQYYKQFVETAIQYNENDAPFHKYDVKKDVFCNYLDAIRIMLLLAVIEKNLISKTAFRNLRGFKDVEQLKEFHPKLLSCFLYIRDCIGHDVELKVFPSDKDKDRAFKQIVSSGNFGFATLDGDSIILRNQPVWWLHQTIVRMYEAGFNETKSNIGAQSHNQLRGGHGRKR